MSGIGILNHSGFISSIHKDTLSAWYTTTSANEIIEFKEADGTQRYLNALTIEAENSPLFVRMLTSDYCLYVPANSGRTYNFANISSIQIMGALGQKVRWSGMFF